MQLDRPLPHLIEVIQGPTWPTIIWSRQPSRPDMRDAVTAYRVDHPGRYRIGHSWPGYEEQNAPSAAIAYS